MALANVNITDTFDVWRTRTNQLIVAVDQGTIITNAAFTKANTGGTVSFAAFDKANAANYFAYLINANTVAAFDKANTGGSVSYLAFDKANSANYFAYLVNANTTAAFDTANTANVRAVAAFDKANNAGGGFYRGNNGEVGSVSGKNDIFRVNSNYINGNIYFNAGENASATGPLSVNVGFILQINTDARVVII